MAIRMKPSRLRVRGTSREIGERRRRTPIRSTGAKKSAAKPRTESENPCEDYGSIVLWVEPASPIQPVADSAVMIAGPDRLTRHQSQQSCLLHLRQFGEFPSA